MYLAEDRILCVDLFCRKNCTYTLKFLPNVKCVTDAMPTLIGLLN